MELARNTFTLRQLLISISCLAVVLGMINLNTRYAENFETRGAVLATSLFVASFAIGGGIGVLRNRFWKGAAYGLFFAACVLFMFFLMPTVRT